VPTVLLIRHALTDATGKILSGRTPGLHLDERGIRQAEALRERLRPVPLAAFVVSPLERCRETASLVLGDRAIELLDDERLSEVDYGAWTGRQIKALAHERLWEVVQVHPSAAQFPGGEALRATQARAVDAVRDWNARLGSEATWALCSHGDVIKAVLADALGLHLDQFQRIHVDPCSLSVVRYTELRPLVLRINDTGDIGDLLRPRASRRRARRGVSARPATDSPTGAAAGVPTVRAADAATGPAAGSASDPA
jgi:probable phosphomutase (TIGR03848 family)